MTDVSAVPMAPISPRMQSVCEACASSRLSDWRTHTGDRAVEILIWVTVFLLFIYLRYPFKSWTSCAKIAPKSPLEWLILRATYLGNQCESLSNQARKRLHNVLIAARWLAQTVQNIGNARRVFFPSSSPPGGPRTFWITSGDGRMAPLSRTPPGDKSRAIIAPRRLRDAEDANITKKRVTEADVRWTGPRKIGWPLVVDEGNGKNFRGPKTFREVATALGSSARTSGKSQNMCDYRSSGVKGLLY